MLGRSGYLIRGFTLENIIGEPGSFGTVYLARKDREIIRAVKILHSQLLSDPDLQRRLGRESVILEKLNQGTEKPEGIPFFYDAGIDWLVDNKGRQAEQIAFLIMHYVEGTDLHHLLKERKLPDEGIIRIAHEAAKILDYAHKLEFSIGTEKTRGIIHTDVRPSNILIRPDGSVAVTDFGLARIIGQMVWGSTLSATIAGPYCTPEMRKNQPLGPQSDIYQLGKVIWEACTGLPEYHPELTIKNPDLRRIVEQATRLEPRDRYQSMKEMAYDLENLLNRKKTIAVPQIPKPSVTAPTAPTAPKPTIPKTSYTHRLSGIGIDREQIKAIQRVIGAKPDGIEGPETDEKLRECFRKRNNRNPIDDTELIRFAERLLRGAYGVGTDRTGAPKVPSLDELYKQAASAETGEEKSSLLEKIVAQNPEFRDAKKQLVIAYKKEIDGLKNNKEYAQALKLAQHLSEILPNEGEPHGYLRSVYFAMGNIPKAIEHGETAVRLLPDNFWSHYYLGEVYYREELRRAKTPHLLGLFDPQEPGAWEERKLALERAIQCYEKALQIKPGDSSAEAKLYKTKHSLEELVRIENEHKQQHYERVEWLEKQRQKEAKEALGYKLKVGAAIILFAIAGTGLWINRDYIFPKSKPAVSYTQQIPEATPSITPILETMTPEAIYTPEATATPEVTATPTQTPTPSLEEKVTEAEKNFELGGQYVQQASQYLEKTQQTLPNPSLSNLEWPGKSEQITESQKYFELSQQSMQQAKSCFGKALQLQPGNPQYTKALDKTNRILTSSSLQNIRETLILIQEESETSSKVHVPTKSIGTTIDEICKSSGGEWYVGGKTFSKSAEYDIPEVEVAINRGNLYWNTGAGWENRPIWHSSKVLSSLWHFEFTSSARAFDDGIYSIICRAIDNSGRVQKEPTVRSFEIHDAWRGAHRGIYFIGDSVQSQDISPPSKPNLTHNLQNVSGPGEMIIVEWSPCSDPESGIKEYVCRYTSPWSKDPEPIYKTLPPNQRKIAVHRDMSSPHGTRVTDYLDSGLGKLDIWAINNAGVAGRESSINIINQNEDKITLEEP